MVGKWEIRSQFHLLLLVLVISASMILFENNLFAQAETLDLDSKFVFHWESDSSVTGSEYSSYINEPVQIRILDSKITIPHNSAAQKLQHDYGIILSNEEIEWQKEQSFALLEMMKTIPQNTRNNYEKQNLELSKWILIDEHIDDDIQFTRKDSNNIVRISIDAFDNANPTLASLDGKQGKYFSQRLHHALVEFVTDNGHNENAVEKILNERYGVSAQIPDYVKLTQSTTNESENAFQKFHWWELVEIINMFEEMPQGFHSIDGFDFLVRRADGVPHPIHPGAPAVAWISSSPGYLEFMESAFRIDNNYLHKLIIHEKSHFLWDNLFSNQLKDDWAELGRWYEDQSDSGWSTTKTTEFVSSYAHGKNPDEDMAESIAYFVINPEKLKSRSLPKYEFIQDRIMQDTTYISEIREDLSFDVYNLNPDYSYPGKIKRVDVSIIGKKDEDKKATIEIELISKTTFQGAKKAYLRLFSEIGTFKDLYLRPVNGDSDSVLRGELVISKNAKNGFWYTNQIIVTDTNGNQRFEGQNDFGWEFFINNSDEDTIPPEYVENTLKLDVKNDLNSYQKPVQILTVSWQVNENQEMKNCFTRIKHEDPQSYSMDSWGKYDAKNQTCNVYFKLTEYNRSGIYIVRYFMMNDMAGNQGKVGFTKLSENQSISIITENQDTHAPYLDVNNITVIATPTNPEIPTGETKVNIEYFANDDLSGLGLVSYTLRDPQGIEHHNYHYHENFYSLFFEGNPDELLSYGIHIILPENSPPGKWGLLNIKLVDKADNQKTYDFTEILHFQVEP